MPFELYEVIAFENNCVQIETVGKSKIKINDFKELTQNPKVREVSGEVEVYTEDMHLKYLKDERMIEIYNELKNRMYDELSQIEQAAMKMYMGFRYKNTNKNFVSIWFQKKTGFEVCLGLKTGELKDTLGISYDIANRKWTAMQYAVKVNKNTNLDDVMDLIRQAYKKREQ